MDNDIFPNKFKAALAAHQVQIGCWCALASPISTEVLGLAGFDWLVLDGEHAPNDVSTLIPQLMALKGSSSAQVVRVPTNEPVIIKRMLDIGFYNFLMPFVETAEQAAQAVASTRYPPEGIRGSPFPTAPICLAPCRTTSRSRTRTSPFWCRLRASRAWITSMRLPRPRALTVCLSARATWPPRLGHLGNAAHPEVQRAIQHIFASAKKHGKPSGILAPVEADARRYLEWGATFVAVGSDLGVFRSATQKLADAFKK
jgi:2-dehydro-3-deoxyglucarate aldolase